MKGIQNRLLVILVIVGALFLLTPAAFAEGHGEGGGGAQAWTVNPQSGNPWDFLKPIEGNLSSFAGSIVEGFGGFGESPIGAPPSQQGGGGIGNVPFRSPAPAFSRNLLLSRESGTPIHTEPHIAVNPTDPHHLIVADTDYGLSNSPVYVSFDSGENWEGPIQVPLIENTRWGGDPVLAFDRNGQAYQVFMSIGIRFYDMEGEFFLPVPRVDIGISSSDDGGLSWQPAVTTVENKLTDDLVRDEFGRLRGVIKFSFLDKPWFAIGPNPRNLAEDVFYITYTEFTQYFSLSYSGELFSFNSVRSEATIMLVTSQDRGVSWSAPQEISERHISVELGAHPGEEVKLRAVQGSYPQVANDGTAYIVWYDSLEDGFAEGEAAILLVRSEDGGESWSKAVEATHFLEVPRVPSEVSFRMGSAPRLALGPDNEIYIVHAGRPKDKPVDQANIYFVRSLDGKKFDKPMLLNQDRTTRLQFFPAITTDPLGTVHVMWGDMRDDPVGLRYNIYYTRSLDRGENWGFEFPEQGIKEPDVRVTDFPSNPNRGFRQGLFIGDYFGIAATEDDVFMVWADTRLGEFGPMSQKIAFARGKAIPSPEVFLNPASGPGGQEVTVQAFGLQPDMNAFVRIGGQVTPVGRTNGDGRFTYRFFVPISSEGSHELVVYDESGNVASASYFTTFGFDDLASRELLEDLAAQLAAQSEEDSGVAIVDPMAPQGERTLVERLDELESGVTLNFIVLVALGAVLVVVLGLMFAAYIVSKNKRVTP